MSSGQPSTRVVPVANLREFFRDELHGALEKQQVMVEDQTEYYVVNLLTRMTAKPGEGDSAASGGGGVFAPDFEDEIVAGSCVTHDGAINHEPTRAAIEGPIEGEATS